MSVQTSSVENVGSPDWLAMRFHCEELLFGLHGLSGRLHSCGVVGVLGGAGWAVPGGLRAGVAGGCAAALGRYREGLRRGGGLCWLSLVRRWPQVRQKRTAA